MLLPFVFAYDNLSMLVGTHRVQCIGITSLILCQTVWCEYQRILCYGMIRTVSSANERRSNKKRHGQVWVD